MTTSGYIVVGILMLLDIISIAVCEIMNEEEAKSISIGILVFLIGLVLYTLPV